jgi:hypothetical protein
MFIQEIYLKKNYVFYYLSLSISAALIIILFTIFSQLKLNSVIWNDKLFLSSFIIIGCLFGITLGFYPGWLKKYSRNGKEVKVVKKNIKRKREGHHPDCDKFQNHTILINNKKFCTGCLGLSLGCITSILLVIFYLIFDIIWSSIVVYFFVFIGLIMIFLSFIETMLPRKNGIIHIILNLFLVLGFLLVTISIFEITGNIIYGFIGIIFSVLWLDTRIQLSNWRHSLICLKCIEKCKMY